MSEERLSAKEVQKATATRGTLYRFLSRGFSLEVDEPFLEWVVKLQPVIEQLAEENDDRDFVEGSRLLKRFVEKVKADFERDKGAFLTDLAAEYASLFLNVGPRPVHLVESVYLGKNHLLYEEPYFDVIRIYRLYEFKKRASFREPEDHIAIELEFMAHLCDFTVKSIESGKLDYAAGYLDNQREFLESHICKWSPQLAEKLNGASKNPFYLSLGALLKGFVTVDGSLIPHLADGLGSRKRPDNRAPEAGAAS
jgi:TorA-specific chaperone